LEVLKQAEQRIEKWLQDMGLNLNPKKTRVTHTLTSYEGKVGFDFLGCTIRHYRVGKTHSGKATNGKPLGFKTLIKPSKEAIQRHTRRTGEVIRALKSAPQAAVIVKLNQIIPGWCNYYKTVVAAKSFALCDDHLYHQLMSWGNGRHAKKGKDWIYKRYWQREDGKRWVFRTSIKTEKEVKLLKLRMHKQTHIQRHVKVRGNASRYNGDLLYWSKRLTDHPLMDSTRAKLLKVQKGQCLRCGLYFHDGDLLEVDHIVPTALGGKDILSNKWVYHRHCHDEKTAEDLAHIKARTAAGINNN